jgi:hypothetical protein
MNHAKVVRNIAGLVVLGSTAALLAVVVACGSSGGTGSCDSHEAGLACEAGSVLSMGRCMNVAGNLDGLRWQLPCTMPGDPVCITDVDGSDTQVLTTTLGGAPGQMYAVTLHFRGEVEQKTYVGGDAGPPVTAGAQGLANAQLFVSGGADNGDTWNIYEMQVSDPPGVYFLNSGMSNITNVFWLDFLATIPMKAGATLTLTANAVDDREIENVNGIDGGAVLVPGVPPYPQAYDGQFVQMDVVSVVAMP